MKRRLPAGTSDYQASWILDSGSEDDEGKVIGVYCCSVVHLSLCVYKYVCILCVHV